MAADGILAGTCFGGVVIEFGVLKVCEFIFPAYLVGLRFGVIFGLGVFSGGFYLGSGVGWGFLFGD